MIFSRAVFGLVVGVTLAIWTSGVWTSAVWAADEHSSAADEHAVGEAAKEAVHESGGHAEPVDTNPLEFKSDLALWTAVVFLVLLAILKKFAWGPIMDGLEKRENRFAEEISSAERANLEAKQMLDDYKQKLADAGDEVRQMINTAKQDAEKVGTGIVDKARGEAEAEHRRALEEIDTATAGALKDLAARSASLAVDLAGKIVDARLDPKAHTELIEKAVANFAAETPSSN